MGRFELQNIWCAIPVYNNAATLHDVVNRALKQVAHVIVVDDGSTDTDVAKLLADLNVTLLVHQQNLGKGAALLTAMRHAADRGGRFLITLDADGQHFPEDIPAFMSQLEQQVILLGQRAHVQGTMPRRSRFGRAFSDFWIRVETGQRVCDTQSGFRAYPLEPVGQLLVHSRQYHFEVEVITRALWAGFGVEAVPIRVWYAEPDKRVSSFRPFWDNLHISLLHLRLVLRQALPWPHRRLASAPAKSQPSARMRMALTEHATPLGLAAAAALGVLVAALPWVLPRLALLLWLSFRWHINKPVALAFHALGLLPVIPWACTMMGWLVVGQSGEPSRLWSYWPYPTSHWWPWLLGSTFVGPTLAAAAAIVVYQASLRFIDCEQDT